MCRALLYIGKPLLLDNLLYEPDSSLVKQSFSPQMLHMLNLAGFGMLAWDEASHAPDDPFRYHSTRLPVFDRNLKSLANKVRADCVLAHVRGVAYRTDVQVSEQNTHPFYYPGAPVALAHNGDLYRIDDIRHALYGYMRAEHRSKIAGTTDSEVIYALLLSQLEPGKQTRDSIADGLQKTLAIIGDERQKAGIDTSSSVNLFVTDGSIAVAVRYCFDFGCYRTETPERVHEANLNYLSLWYTIGRDFALHDDEWKMVGDDRAADSLIIASEPLTHDVTTWLEIPPYSMLTADLTPGQRGIEIQEIQI